MLGDSGSWGIEEVDDDNNNDDNNNDDDNGGSGAGSIKVNGQSYNLTYGFWDAGTSTLNFVFSNYNLANRNPAAVPSGIGMLIVVEDISSPQPGTYNAALKLSSFDPTATEIVSDGFGIGLSLTIAKSGDKYTFTIPETTIYCSQASSTTAPFSFSWTGTLVNYKF